ncbi:BCCT family transporter, partial [Staphylococcus epidermidis]|uniref:BCCT family transporter n=1 Tax=Staphylococcus epidermidis TaxID=1282 RepID=UPI0037D9B2CD
MSIASDVRSYYLIVTTLILFFCLFFIFTPIPKLKLAKPNHKPQFNTISSFAILFTPPIPIPLLFYPPPQPIPHFPPPPTPHPQTTNPYTDSLTSTFFHSPFHPSPIYPLLPLPLPYSQFPKPQPPLISTTLPPLFADKLQGPIPTLIHVLSLFPT